MPLPPSFNSQSIDSRFILASDLQGLFRDKTTGLPLRGGSVSTFSENDHITPKYLWMVSGSPGGPYTYTALPDPLPLTGIGTYSDGMSNDIIPYWFPYEGLPQDFSTVVELYFVQVYDINNTPQFSRIAWPNFSIPSQNNIDQISNFITNGQFIAHNNIWQNSEDDPSTEGIITQPITQIAPGGWTFERPSGSTATDQVLFTPYTSPITPGNQPTGNPRYAVNVSNLGVGSGNTFKDLRIKFKDVNKFSSTTQNYTFSFTGSIGAGTIPVDLILIKYFGSNGGSSTTETTLHTFTLTTSPQIFQYAFVFGSNQGKNIGSAGDDYIQLALRFPTTGAFSNALLTDFILAFGALTIRNFQDETDESMIGQSASGGLPIPDPDGFDLYLPIVYAQNGFTFDQSIIGKIFTVPYDELNISGGAAYPRPGELFCDGHKYPTFGYSSDGIPYKRLWNVLTENTNTHGLPMFGTGKDYVTCYNFGDLTSIDFVMVTNQPGSVTAPANGLVSPTFNYTKLVTGAPSTEITAYTAGDPTYNLIFRNTIAGPVHGNPDDINTSTFSVVSERLGQTTPPVNDIVYWRVTGVPAAGTSGSPGKYIHFSNTTTDFTMWFNVDNMNIAPVDSGRTLIEVDVKSTWGLSEFLTVVAAAASGFQAYDITVKAQSSIPQSAYFTFSAGSDNFLVWFNTDGAGTPPSVPGTIPIMIPIATGYTAAQVLQPTFGTIDDQYFAVPDLRGVFIRGWNNGSGIDPNAAGRFSYTNADYGGDHIGTIEFDDLLSHKHTTGVDTDFTTTGSSALSPSNTPTDYTGYTGGSETRPINIYMNYVIKY